MPRAKESVRLNGDYINAYLHRNKITAKEFSQKLCYCDLWWTNKNCERRYIVPRLTALAMCDHFGFAWSDIVIEQFHSSEDVPEQPEQNTDVAEFIKILRNIDLKLTAIEQQLDKLKWLER